MADAAGIPAGTRGNFRTRAALAVLAVLPAPLLAQTPTRSPSSPPAPTVDTRVFFRNWTRVESWRFFDPNVGGGDPDYTDIANRLQVGVERRGPRVDLLAAVQYVQFGGLPTNASGPGALGTGAAYFDQGGGRDSRHAYLRYLNVRLKNIAPGTTVQAGRFGYTSGAESPSDDSKIETVKRQRIDSRVVGEFEWALYQRAFDGVRVDVDRHRWHATASAFRPTQGGFEDAAGVEIDRIRLLNGAWTLKPDAILGHADIQVFANRYDDTRAVTARPDNANRSAPVADVHIETFGTSVVAAYPAASGQVDVMSWFAGQTGTWFEQSHRATAAAVEAGFQWPAQAWRPWLRGGFFHASGDASSADDRHGTYFPVMPTVRKYSLSTVYSVMNLNDVFVQALLRPASTVNVRVDLHRLGLANAADLWYAGSGATQKAGSSFGYSGRRSNGATSLGTMLEGTADRTFTRHWSVNGYVGVMRGGDVVRRTFRGRSLTFAYVENVLQF